MSDTPDLVGHRTVLAELRLVFEKMHASADVLDGKAQAIFTATGILIALAAVGQIAVIKTRVGPAFWFGLAIVLALYLAMFVALFIALRPRTFKLPMVLDWDEQCQRYFEEPEMTVCERLIVDYGVCIRRAQDILFVKSRALLLASALFVLIVATILAALFVSVA